MKEECGCGDCSSLSDRLDTIDDHFCRVFDLIETSDKMTFDEVFSREASFFL